MNILICTTHVPFTSGGGELHVENLKRAFVDAGHHAEISAVPFKWYPPEQILRGSLAWRLLDVTEANGKLIDMVVGMKFPAYLVSHPRKVVWVMHQYRAAYELAGTPFDDLSHHPEGESIRNFIKNADETFLPEAHNIFANSKTVADRLRRYNNIESEILYHPPPRAEALRPGEQGDYVFYPSRLEPMKRQELLIEAASLMKSPLKIVLAGSSHNRKHYDSLIKKFKVTDRVKITGYIDEQELIDLYSNAFAVCYVPFEEDYGYVTLEAMYSAKPVVATLDGGGAAELIEDGSEGKIVAPDPAAIAQALDDLDADRNGAKQMGERGLEKVRSMKLSWSQVVDRLISGKR